ncbi:MAG: DUF72 domain-containing protein [Thermoleophilia bacterium]
MSAILVGSCSWTDPSLVACGGFYPPGTCTAEGRLRYYATRFPLVEVDSTYYAPPTERNSVLWVARTPPSFVFDVKAHALLTKHPAEVNLLPTALRGLLPAWAASQRRVYADALPDELLELLWETHRTALAPLAAAGKLGAVLFQFPPWFVRSRANAAYVSGLPGRLPGWKLAIEFRGGGWMEPDSATRTLNLLERAGLAYVCVDEPQVSDASTPPTVAATAELAMVRFHGRNLRMWNAKTQAASERFKYLYSDEELHEWVPRVQELATQARTVHVLFNNNYEDWGMRNAARMRQMLGGSEPREPQTLTLPLE